MAVRIDREALISRLEPIENKVESNEDEAHLQQMSLAGVLLTLAEIDHEHEYDLCRRAALHLLGEVHEPEDISLE